MLRAAIILLTVHIVFSQNDKCLPKKSLQRKLCSVKMSHFHVLRVKVLRDLSSTPEENHRYKVRVLQRMNKMIEKERNSKKLNMRPIIRAFFKNLAPKKLNMRPIIRAFFKNPAPKMIFRNVEIPRECMLTLNKKYILIAKYDRNSENIHVDCNDILDWESLSGFQKGRLRRGGYSCGIEICINDCVDNEGCASTHVPLACRMEKEEENCYDKYAECKPNVETSSGDWEMQDKVFSSCQQLENPIPVFVDPSGSGNGTEPTAVP